MKFALITGASKGIGRAIAEEMASHGFNVLLVARSEALLQEVANDISVKYKVATGHLAIDLSNPGAPETIFNWCAEHTYGVVALVNNAGYGLSGPFEKYPLNENIDLMQVNMMAMVRLCQLFLPELRSQPRAYIMNIASSAAYQAVPNLSLYAASKAFVISFSRGLGQELRGSGVTVTCVSPGSTATGFAQRANIGEKGLKTAAKVNMTAGAVAVTAVRSMMAGKAEVIVGGINKLGAFLVWLLPKGLVERTAMKIYE